MERGRRKTRLGVVVGDKTNQTRTIEVSRDFRHTKYQKVMKRRSKFYAHDEKNETRVGDRVRIMEVRPLSRLKRWNIVEVIKKA